MLVSWRCEGNLMWLARHTRQPFGMTQQGLSALCLRCACHYCAPAVPDGAAAFGRCRCRAQAGRASLAMRHQRRIIDAQEHHF